jgi:diacylglycerol kinase family enzyme
VGRAAARREAPYDAAVRRIVLIVNPYSTGVTRRRVAEVSAALARGAEVVVRETERRGHATELAAQAVGEADALVVFSGDGTYNEAINGAAGELPFGFLPGGGASVFPRALGLPRDPVRAAGQVVAALEQGRNRSIGLGRVNGRRFCFSAGIGFDAEAVRRIDRRGRDGEGRRAGNVVFAATVVKVLLDRRLRIPPQLEIDGRGRAACLFVANGRPYTYLGPFAVTIAGGAEFGGGLDFAAPREIRPSAAPRLALRGIRGTLARDPQVLTGHDLDGFEVRCDRPLPLQADGEDLGDVTEARFEAERGVLSVLV